MSAPTVPEDRVAAVRRLQPLLHRAHRRRARGAAAHPHSLAEARLLFELGEREVTDVADLRRSLDLDAGYLSRLLGAPRGGGARRARALGHRRPPPARAPDRAGARCARRARRALGGETATLLHGVGGGDQDRLLEAMDTIRDVLEQGERSGASLLRAPRPGRPRLGHRAPRRPVRRRVRLGRALRGARRAGRRRLRRAPRPRPRGGLDRRGRRAPRRLGAVRARRRRDRPAAAAARRAERARDGDRRRARRRVPALRARGRLPADGAVDQRRARRGAAHLRARGLRAHVLRAAPQLRGRPRRPDLVVARSRARASWARGRAPGARRGTRAGASSRARAARGRRPARSASTRRAPCGGCSAGSS